jgi:hypothetical protein
LAKVTLIAAGLILLAAAIVLIVSTVNSENPARLLVPRFSTETEILVVNLIIDIVTLGAGISSLVFGLKEKIN